MKHKPRLTIHAVAFGSDSMTAECGELIDGRTTTGHYRPLRSFATDVHVCATCAGAR